ncbi:hypothetical protein L7F22_016156 [Adiantum nelumboides]|nr:hypothetical protein [Adiantum nelumboides]
MALTSSPVLIISNLAKAFVVEADACGDCIDAVLNQEGHAVAFESQRLNDAEKRVDPQLQFPTKLLISLERECTELVVNNWIHRWTTYFDLHEEPDERRILIIPLYLHNKALTWWRDMTEKPTTWADFCTKFKKDFAKMDPLKAYAKLQSLSMKTLSFDKYTTAFKEALTFCKVDATHAVHMYLLGLHEDYRWALIKDKAPTDVEDAVVKARTFHLINGANYEKKRAYDHNLSEGCTPKKKPRFQPKASKIQSRPFDTTPRGAKEKKKAKNAMIADAVKKGACFGCGQTGHQIKDCPNKKSKKPQSRPSVHFHEISGISDRLHLQTRDSDHEYRVKIARGEDIDVWNRMVPSLTLELADYKESLDFHIMCLDRADVILGIPWFFDKQDTLYIDYVHHSLVFVKENMPHVSISLCNQASVNNGFAIPIVIALEMFKDTKSSYVDFYRYASDYALGAALYQDGRLVAFESKTLSDAEMRYPTYEKELYVVIHALKKWRHFLYGSKLIAWTDHHSLRYICDQDDLRGRKARWVELMQKFDFEIRYRKGSTNKVADALSRILEVNALSMAEISIDFYLALRGLCCSDRHFGKVWNEVEMGGDSRIGLGDPKTQMSRAEETRQRQYSIQAGLLFRNGKVCVPEIDEIRQKVLFECHDVPSAGNPGIQRTLALVKRQSNWERYLPQLEFAYNSSKHSATGFSPFMLMYGFEPKSPIAVGLEQVRDRQARDFLYDMQEMLELAKDNIKTARDRVTT